MLGLPGLLQDGFILQQIMQDEQCCLLSYIVIQTCLTYLNGISKNYASQPFRETRSIAFPSPAGQESGHSAAPCQNLAHKAPI